MGQTTSTESDGEVKYTNGKLSRAELDHLFVREATRLFKPIELMSLRSNLGLQELQGSKLVTRSQLVNVLKLVQTPATDDFLDCLHFIAKFPNYRDSSDLTVAGLIKALTILDSDKFVDLFGNNRRYFLMQIYLALSFGAQLDEPSEKSEKSQPVEDPIDVVYSNDKLQWILIPQVQSFDGLGVSKYQLSAPKFLRFIAFLLFVSPVSLSLNPTLPLSEQFESDDQNWYKYEQRAMNLLRSFDLDLSKSNYHTRKIPFNAFERIIGTSLANGSMPHLLDPLHHILDSLLYTTPVALRRLDFSESRILTHSMLAELATILPPDLVYQRLRKLFVGAESGFSMRSMESKVFKWNAPTILLVSGKTIQIQPSSEPAPQNKKYTAFMSEYPRFHASHADSPKLPAPDSDQCVFMVYMERPWRISNGECFGDEHCFIAQLSPRQILFPSSNNAQNFAYFNTLGGGLGFGSKPPLVKNNVRIYRPGEVSLTIEAGMEIASFRHLAIPGTYRTGSVFSSTVPEFEHSFEITNLEVWGCGSEKELAEQKKLWEWENREAEARKKLNSMNWEDGKALLEMAGMIDTKRSGGSV
ncbi:hypothetical protein OGAPHI_000492 [Ogataea philodendri]|uniref:Restriction of telomere capping protein 5 n=1 Tax=Ogataea philodendri TaxID=1378263 RepID=A0A9P8TA62_9ASCO|nr:uncharacterized protein OGAPHI_000492 [Ogataea philodendri]KAH3671269.1 hypothetical protein OGAPHI_000492 [Ogataea philodendri]